MEYCIEFIEAAKSKYKCDHCKRKQDELHDCVRTLVDKENGIYRQSYQPCEKIVSWIKQKRINDTIQLGENFIDKTFENFNVDCNSKDAYDKAVKFCDTYKTGSRGIGIMGGFGAGKTHIVAATILKLLEKNIVGTMLTVPELMQKIKGEFGNSKNSESILDKLKNVPYLVLDDVAAEKPSDWAREQMYILINYRYEHKLTTSFTSNVSEKLMIENVGGRVVSRLYDMCEFVINNAEDYRRKQHGSKE